MTSTYSRIRSTGSSLSSRLAAEPGVDSVDPQTTVSMAELAARRALDDAGLSSADVDFLVIGTTSPDVVFPNVGCLLQKRLDIRGCPAFSVEAGTTGFIYALSIADRFIATGQSRCALVIGAETLAAGPGTGGVEKPGDGIAAAGAVVLETAATPGIVSCHLGADHRFANLPTGDIGPDQSANSGNDALIGADRKTVMSAIQHLRASVDEALLRQELSGTEIDWVIARQTDRNLIRETAECLGIATERIILPPEDYVDSAAAVMPLTLDKAIRGGQIKNGDLLLLMALGGAVTWGSALIRM